MIKEQYFGLRYSSNIAFMLGYDAKPTPSKLKKATLLSQGSQVEADFAAVDAEMKEMEEDEVPQIFRQHRHTYS